MARLARPDAYIKQTLPSSVKRHLNRIRIELISN